MSSARFDRDVFSLDLVRAFGDPTPGFGPEARMVAGAAATVDARAPDPR
jgi:hypothetical protein